MVLKINQILIIFVQIYLGSQKFTQPFTFQGQRNKHYHVMEFAVSQVSSFHIRKDSHHWLNINLLVWVDTVWYSVKIFKWIMHRSSNLLLCYILFYKWFDWLPEHFWWDCTKNKICDKKQNLWLRTFSVNVTKSGRNLIFGNIYWQECYVKASFLL